MPMKKLKPSDPNMRSPKKYINFGKTTEKIVN